MRGWTRRWIMRSDGAEPPETPVQPTQRGGREDLVRRLLAGRGCLDEEACRKFITPSWSDLSHPSTLPGAMEAAIRLVEGVRSKRKIAIYGDYDVDGIMSTAILHHTLRTVDPDLDLRLYVPHRVEEGYGLNREALDQLAGEGVELVVTVDCGITAVDLARHAADLGIELIITDHHTLRVDSEGRPELPEASVIVHPSLPGATAPFTDLCGGGVAFKLAWAFLERWFTSKPLPEVGKQLLLELLPLAAVATIADVVPLLGENRIITWQGLRRLAHVKNEGIQALLDDCGIKPARDSILASDVGFRLAPTLNAAGRMASADDAVELVTTAKGARAVELAARLVKLNKERQEQCRTLTEQAADMAEREGLLDPGNRAIVLAHETWNPGIVGICCSRLAERFGRPVILLHRDEDVCRGSARSVPGYSIHDALHECARLLNVETELLVFGGHDAAAGLTVQTRAFGDLREKMLTHASGAIKEADLLDAIEVDGTVACSDLNLSVMLELEKLDPFGAGNPPPSLILESVTVTSVVKMGTGGRHLRAQVSCGGQPIKAVWWSGSELLERLHEAERNQIPLDLLVEPQVDRWLGRNGVQLRVLDVRTSGCVDESVVTDQFQSTS